MKKTLLMTACLLLSACIEIEGYQDNQGYNNNAAANQYNNYSTGYNGAQPVYTSAPATVNTYPGTQPVMQQQQRVTPYHIPL